MKKTILAIFVVGLALVMAGSVFAVNGASTVNTVGQSSRMTSPTAGNVQALAGNLTELDIVSDSVTQTWQGYFGNVSGTIQLQDSSGNTMYNWSAASPSGEVLASVNQTVDWANIACASATNITALEARYGATGATDDIGATFTQTASTTIASKTVSNCEAVHVYDDAGNGVSGDFKELLLWDGDAAVYASILNQDVLGFDDKTHDFEMLVLEDGHNNADEKTYYFFVELD